MTHLADAVGMLIRQHTMRIHFLPGSPDTHYRVRAPALLTQLHDAITTGNTGSGARIPGSRLPLDPAALDLWHHIHTSVHGWARELGIDRRPYTALARADVEREREPAWVHTLRPWLQPVAWDEQLAAPTPIEPIAAPKPAPRRQPLGDHGLTVDIPPIGRLLRATAAAAATHEDITRTMTRRSWCGRELIPADCTLGCWTHRIQTLLATITEDRAIRGAECWVCRTGKIDPNTGTEVFMPTTTTTIDQDGEKLRVPAIVVRVAELPGAGPDDLWIYRMCRACGAEGWLDYTTTTGDPPKDERIPA